MSIGRREFGMGLGAGLIAPHMALAQSDSLYTAQWRLVFGTRTQFEDALVTLREHGKPDIAAGLIQQMRFTRGGQPQIAAVLAEVTGEDFGTSWFDWMLWQEANPQIKPHESFQRIKRDMFMQIDPNFDDFLAPKYITPDAMRIRLEEISWGGVIKDGIPSLDNPTLIAPADADYIRDDDLVFGVSINGDARAYPLRIMGWHEMFNDVIGGVPLALAYCTLCGSGILFETQVEGRDAPLVFGSSGFLYRSNKLMFDRGTNSLWNQFTGKPVVGKLVDSGIDLKQRPVVIDTWANWLADNPSTTVLSLNTGYSRDYGSGVVYNDYFASPDLMFPTLVDERVYRQKDYVFGVRAYGGAKAWPLEAFEAKSVINDAIGQTPLVLIGDAATRSVRAYERGGLAFTQAEDGLRDQNGGIWSVDESGLIMGDARLPRVAGHIAYWFAWNGYLGAESELYTL